MVFTPPPGNLDFFSSMAANLISLHALATKKLRTTLLYTLTAAGLTGNINSPLFLSLDLILSY